MSFKMRLLVVSVYYNRESMVDESVASVADQLEEQDQLLLIDDGSKDDTLSKLKAFESDRVKVLPYKNMGFVNALINAIKSCDSEYIAIHGAGDISLPGRFKEQLNVFQMSPEVGVVGSYYKDIDVKLGSEKVVRNEIRKPIKTTILEYNPFSHGSVMFRRSVYEQVGGYRPFFKFAQDRDLWCRMSLVCDFHILKEVYSLRYKSMGDSVSGDYRKALQQRYLSDFATFEHRKTIENAGHTGENIDISSLYFSPSFDLLKDLFKRSVRAFQHGDEQALLVYKTHALQGIGLIFYPAYVCFFMFPGICRWAIGFKKP